MAAAKPEKYASDLERRIFKLILEFPERIDEMETRNEDNCRALAARIARLVESFKPPPAQR